MLSGYDTEKRNKVIESELGWSRETWKQLAEIGILGLGFDEDSGPIEAMVVLTELGHRLAPEPVAAAALVPGAVIAAHGSVEQRALLDEVAAGEKLLAFAHRSRPSRFRKVFDTKASGAGDAGR